MIFPNKVKEAVNMAGGPTFVALQAGCSGTAVQAWIRNGRVSNMAKAKILSQLSGVPIKELRPC